MKAKTSSKLIATFSIAFGLMLLIASSLTNNNLFSYTSAQENNNTTNVRDTFTISGPISSLVYVPGNNTNISKTMNLTGQLNSINKFVLAGNWSITVKQGEITDFKTSFTKVLADGNKRHTHDLINFKQDNNTKALLTGNNNLSVKGLVDVKLNKDTPWNKVYVDINIE